DPDNPLVYSDFAYDNQGYEAPFGFYELNIIKNDEAAPGEITSVDDFKAFVEKYPGKFTYPSSDNWVGAAFIRTVIYNTCDNYEDLMTVDPTDTEAIKEIIQPALDYLKSLNANLWNEGKTFPATNDEMTQLFKNGEIYNDILYDQYGCGTKIKSGEYPESAHSYIFQKSTANFSYWAIPYNSPNKAGALVVINEMLSPEQQLAKSEASAGDVLDHTKLTSEQQAQFDNIDHGPNNRTDEELQAAATAEYSADVEAAITQIWKDEVVGK
ncbi:MAG: ABC transporter substrate-binding protein, partial [Coriobacteriales bacterium]